MIFSCIVLSLSYIFLSLSTVPNGFLILIFTEYSFIIIFYLLLSMIMNDIINAGQFISYK